MPTPLPTSTELVAQLRASDRAEPSRRRGTISEWDGNVATGTWPAELVGDVALLLLTTLTEEDGSLDMVGAALMQRHGQDVHLKPLKRARRNLRGRATLRDWRLEVDRATSMIEARSAGTCECVPQAKHGASAKGPLFEMQKESVDKEQYSMRFEVRCRRCGTLWSVREEHGYHYPLSYWSKRSG